MKLNVLKGIGIAIPKQVCQIGHTKGCQMASDVRNTLCVFTIIIKRGHSWTDFNLCHVIVYVWSQYDGANIEQWTNGYGWRKNQKAKLKIVGRFIPWSNQHEADPTSRYIKHWLTKTFTGNLFNKTYLCLRQA